MEEHPEKSGRSVIMRGAIFGAILLIALFLAGKAFGWWPNAGSSRALKLFGNVEIREVQLGFRLGGRISELLVDEGDLVTAGQVLARLDTRPLADRLASADARLAGASAGVAKDLAGSRPQQVRAEQAGLADAQAGLLEASRQHERRRALLGRGFISRADFQSSEAAVSAARARVEAAQASLSLVGEGPRREDRAVTIASRAVVQAERQAIQTDISDAELRAVEAGQVLTRAKEAGSVVQPGQTVLSLALTQPVRIRAYVAEPDLPKVRPGMQVKVSVDGTEKQWPARIGFISPVAEFTPKNAQTEQLRADLVYRLRLTVEDPQGELRQGQPVTVHLPASTENK